MKNAVLSSTVALLLGACSSMPSMPSMPKIPMSGGPVAEKAPAADEETPTAPAAEAPPPNPVNLALELMGKGKATAAKAALQTALAATPTDATALRLLEQIEADPVKLLGPPTREHVIVAGDTMSVLADQYLGDRLMFFALAKYNGLAAPNALAVGKVLKIPARPAHAQSAAAVAESRLPTAAKPTSRVDQEKASAVRLRALQSLNEGNVTHAVALLKEAQALNASDPAIQKDLERAMRIQSALSDG